MTKHLLFLFLLFIPFIGTTAVEAEPIVTESTTESTINSNSTSETTVNSPPPSAIAPSINSANSDLCTVGVSGAVQTQILGISGAKMVRDMNCEKLKNAKTMYDMGMKVAAVSVMCQDERVFEAMLNAGTPCPKDGLVGDKARLAWEMEAVKEEIKRDQNNPMRKIFNENVETKTGLSVIISTLAFLLFL